MNGNTQDFIRPMGAQSRRPAPKTIREKVDAELRHQFIKIQRGGVPSERWSNVRRGRTRPFGTLTSLLLDARNHGYEREAVRGAVIASATHAVDVVFNELKPAA